MSLNSKRKINGLSGKSSKQQSNQTGGTGTDQSDAALSSSEHLMRKVSTQKSLQISKSNNDLINKLISLESSTKMTMLSPRDTAKDQSLSKSFKKLSMMLKSKPEMYPGASKKTMEMWKEHGPLTIAQIIKYSNVDNIDIDNDEELEFKRVDYFDGYEIGQFKKGTKVRHGIARFVDINGDIGEGLYQNDKRNGFSR